MPAITKKRTTTAKKPKTADDTILIGVECEFTHPGYNRNNAERNDRADLNAVCAGVVDDLGLELDASGRDGGGVEVITEPYNFKWWKAEGLKLFTKMMAVFSSNNYTADNQYAGIHIHIDRSIFSFEQFMKFVKFLSENRTFMEDISRRGRRTAFVNPATTTGKYGQPFVTANTAVIENAYKAAGSDYGNQCITLNSNGNGTIECRFFNGTLDPSIAMSCIELVRALCYFIKSKRDKTLHNFIIYLTDYPAKYNNLIAYLKTKGYYTPTGKISIAKLTDPTV